MSASTTPALQSEFPETERAVATRTGHGVWAEILIGGFAIASVVFAQLALTGVIRGANYYGIDGKMAQTTVLTTLRFGGILDITNINPLQGIGSQLLTKNAWANPAFWPFVFLDKEAATDVSAAIALGCFALGCYIMMRCFDVPRLPSAIAAQLTIGLFAPVLLLIYTPTNFCLTPGDAVVYVPYMVALGLLARLEPGSTRRFWLITAGITALLFYSTYCDPLWTGVAVICWALSFVTVTLWPFRFGVARCRCAALLCCLAVFVVTGVAFYFYGASQYTARVLFAAALDRERGIAYVSAVSYSANMKYFHLLFVGGFAAGLVAARGRTKTLILSATFSWLFYLCYSLVYLLVVDAVWVQPIPIYMEQCLFVLFVAASVAGYWAALQRLAGRSSEIIRRTAKWPSHVSRPGTGQRVVAVAVTTALVAILPIKIIEFARRDAGPYSSIYYQAWPDQPELDDFFVEHLALRVGAPFRGSVNFLAVDHDAGGTMADMWSRGVPTADEYSQLVSPTSMYFLQQLLNKDIRGSLNQFQPNWAHGDYRPVYWKALAALGIRYTADRKELPESFNPGLSLATFPYRPQSSDAPQTSDQKPGLWYVYELAQPNLGDYSPTVVETANTGSAIMAAIGAPGFDFTKQVVLSEPISSALVPASDAQMSFVRDGWHFRARSDGTSLVILPQQFSNCFQARDPKVRVVRADLLLTGIVFSGYIDTDIIFDYGLFHPWCRIHDVHDMRSLDIHIDQRMPHLVGARMFPDWQGAVARLEAAAKLIR